MWKVRQDVLERSAPVMRDNGHLSALKLSSKTIGGKDGCESNLKTLPLNEFVDVWLT